MVIMEILNHLFSLVKKIWKLFVLLRYFISYIKRLLLINTSDCLYDMTNPVYLNKIKNTSIADMREQGYIRLAPKIPIGENEEVKSYLVISFDNFSPNNTNPYFRDCIIEIDILCVPEYWDVGNYRVRPIQIAGYIDGILKDFHMEYVPLSKF